MSCSAVSDQYSVSRSPSSHVKMLARGHDEDFVSNELSYSANDIVRDHWKQHCHTSRSHSEAPHTQQSNMSHTRTRHTYSQPRTQFSYTPRTRYNYNPSSLPSSPLSMSGVYSNTVNTPPSSAHLHPPSPSPYSPTTHTSPVSSLTSSGMYVSTYREQSTTLTSSYPSLGSQLSNTTQINRPLQGSYQHHQDEGSNMRGRYRSATPHTGIREDLLSVQNNDHDWRSESWSAPSTIRYPPSSYTGSTHPLNYRTSQSHSNTNMRPKLTLPGSSLDTHLPNSPPGSHVSSPHHLSSSQRSIYSSSPNSFIDIVCHPRDAYIELGDPILLHCEAHVSYTSDKPLYQWYKDEEPLIGEVENVLKVTRASKEDLGYYFCVVSNTTRDCQRKSSTASVKIFNCSSPIAPCKPAILDQPDSTVFATLGERISLRLTVRAQPDPYYQWFKNGSELHSATKNELVISYMTLNDEGQYICSIKNELGAILSETYGVYVIRRKEPLERSCSSSSNDYNEISTIQQHSYNSPNPPSSPTKRVRPHNNSDYTERQFSPVIWGVTPPLSPTKKIRPSSNSNNISCEVVQFISSRICRQIGPGENTEGVRLALGISLAEAQSIRLKCNSLSELVKELIHKWMNAVSNVSVALLEESLQEYGFMVSVPSLTTTESYISQTTPPIIKRIHPESVQANAGEIVEISVIAEGSGLTYQWYKDGIPYPGLTHYKVKLTDVQDTSSGFYHCCIKNSYGTVNTQRVRVDIIPMKLKLPPSLQGKCYYGPSPRESPQIGGVFSPPPSYTPKPAGYGDSDSLPQHGSSVFNERKFISSVSERLENLRIEESPNNRPTIIQHPVSQTLSFGEMLNVTVVCIGSGKLRYSWYFNGLAMRTERQSEFILNCFTEEDVGDYSCEIANEFGTVMSDKAAISLRPDDDDNK